jgi:hypothetical protein
VRALLLLALFVLSGLNFAGPVVEGDYFWHLRQGQRHLQEGRVPLEFPTQWLGQVLLYGWWKLSGYGGMVLLRALGYTAILGLLWGWMRRKGVPFFWAFLTVFLSAGLLKEFPSERPQLLSFLLLPPFLGLLEAARAGRAWAFLALPAVLLLWGNVHAGALIGAAALLLYALAEGLLALQGRGSFLKAALMALAALAPFGVLFALLPQALGALWGILGGMLSYSLYQRSVLEYLSPLEAALGLGHWHPAYWALLGLTGVALLRGARRGMPLHHVLLALAFLALSLRAVRFMPLLSFLLPLTAPWSAPRASDWHRSGRLLGLFASVLLVWALLSPPAPRLKISEEFPSKAVQFLKAQRPLGRVFNYYGWAGYLAWELPRWEFFMPVQDIGADVSSAYQGIIWGSQEPLMGRPRWQALLRAYGLEAVLMPGLSPISGELYPLLGHLVRSPQWSLVYSDQVANLFVRAPVARGAGLKALDKRLAYRQVRQQAERMLRQGGLSRKVRQTLQKALRELNGDAVQPL